MAAGVGTTPEAGGVAGMGWPTVLATIATVEAKATDHVETLANVAVRKLKCGALACGRRGRSRLSGLQLRHAPATADARHHTDPRNPPFPSDVHPNPRWGCSSISPPGKENGAIFPSAEKILV